MASVLAARTLRRSLLAPRMMGVMGRRAATSAAASKSPASWSYVPGGPIFQGGPNDATSFPPSSRSTGSHHWAFERLLAASLIPITAGAFATSGSAYAILDGMFAIGLVMHSHLGFDQCVVDYLHPRKFPIFGPFMTWVLRGLTLGTLAGLYQFNTNDIGLTELIKKEWAA